MPWFSLKATLVCLSIKISVWSKSLKIAENILSSDKSVKKKKESKEKVGQRQILGPKIWIVPLNVIYQPLKGLREPYPS